MDKKDYLIDESEPQVIQNKMWFDDDGALYLRCARIDRTDFLRFVSFLVENTEHKDEILSECFPAEFVKDYATKKLDMYTADEWNTSPEEDAR
jgi:hypothetical protein